MKVGKDDSDTNPFRYCAEYYDKETGSIYLRARYYDPATSRMLSEDSYRGDIKNPLSLNLYTYCGNNPIRYADPSGKTWQEILKRSYVGPIMPPRLERKEGAYIPGFKYDFEQGIY